MSGGGAGGRPPFERRKAVEGPALVGAEWWQEGLASAADPVARRGALVALGAIVGVTAVAGAGIVALATSSSGPSDEVVTPHDALEAQRDYGWSFGAEGEALAFDGSATQAPDRAALVAAAAAGMPPAQARLRPFYQATLFEALRAVPVKGNVETVKPLAEAIAPASGPSTEEAFRRGRALASLFEGRPADAALYVDLPGPEAVAFAAGASERFDPVFTFDNWPHPRGVVPAHLTLAALAYYQPAFARHAAARAGEAPPAFVLDRNRLRPYTDEASQFDNRYVAKVPGPEQLRALGVKHVLYVGPDGAGELDDLNEDFVAYGAAGVDVKAVAAADFVGSPEAGETAASGGGGGGAGGAARAPAGAVGAAAASPGGATYYYGGSPSSHVWFWHHYGWYAPPRLPAVPPPHVSGGHAYRPAVRPTFFRGSGFVGMQKPKPGGFGRVPVVYSRSSGTVYGPRFGRSGSWGRAGSWSGGSS